jgi:crotonobetainyl-CoA:carnitine CoA-transferase CaiB-like acyl-CoA transferase
VNPRTPFAGLRVVELGTTLAARLAGLLFADQGAQVLVARPGIDARRTAAPACAGADPTLGFEHLDPYLDRGKTLLETAGDEEAAVADLVLVDGDRPLVHAPPSRIVVRVLAALPDDPYYGHWKADCSEDLLSATLGLYTDMAITGRLLGRPVIYTPLPLSSVYTAVIAAVAAGAALLERLHSGRGREILASRLAGGLSAVGALGLKQTGLPAHLDIAPPAPVPAGLAADAFAALIAQARDSAERQAWLERRLVAVGMPYRTLDGRFVLLVTGANRRATRRLYRHLGLWDTLLARGLTDVSPFEPRALAERGRNLADAPSLDFRSLSIVAGLLEPIMASRTAAHWERELCALGVVAAEVKSLQEWLVDPQARQAGLTVVLPTDDGPALPQPGRAAWIASARPYPPLVPARRLGHAQGLEAARSRLTLPPGDRSPSRAGPLAGRVVVDLTNVVAGPNGARMFGELGATVYRVEHPEPGHIPLATTVWAAEAGAGKRSIILDASHPEGREVLERLLARADLVMINKGDAQCERLGLDPAALHRRHPRLVLVQLTAHHGEQHGGRHDHPGYDPVGQALTGILQRFGPPGCPTYHGLASCVDYLSGYLGVWAGIAALYARALRDSEADAGPAVPEKAETSLMAAATLMGCAFLYTEPPAHQCGPGALGRSATQRAYPVADGWVYAIAGSDLSAELAGLTVGAALERLGARGIDCARVDTVRALADRHRGARTGTIRLQSAEHQGWVTECFVPTWFCFDGVSPAGREGPVRIGSSAAAVLAELGYGPTEVERLQRAGVVSGTEWRKAGQDGC